jgi:hypothetical protein
VRIASRHPGTVPFTRPNSTISADEAEADAAARVDRGAAEPDGV